MVVVVWVGVRLASFVIEDEEAESLSCALEEEVEEAVAEVAVSGPGGIDVGKHGY